eukprot:TRINITY_DN2357_c0_g1_i1.p1 TRINITY_DN2357_c0_g1~~TRINITY_DN2357_c0_g1_i1.p1  ORF type:complete len:266 (-),score=23.30 TRINITY_DN2357_c0_g1_i1:482-1279(-)
MLPLSVSMATLSPSPTLCFVRAEQGSSYSRHLSSGFHSKIFLGTGLFDGGRHDALRSGRQVKSTSIAPGGRLPRLTICAFQKSEETFQASPEGFLDELPASGDLGRSTGVPSLSKACSRDEGPLARIPALTKTITAALVVAALLTAPVDSAIAAQTGGRVGGSTFRSSSQQQRAAPPSQQRYSRPPPPTINRSRTNIYVTPPPIVAPPLFGGYFYSPPPPPVILGGGGGGAVFSYSQPFVFVSAGGPLTFGALALGLIVLFIFFR